MGALQLVLSKPPFCVPTEGSIFIVSQDTVKKKKQHE